jgi:hypothetical protein
MANPGPKPKFINQKNGYMAICGPAVNPVKYSSVPTRYAGLHWLQNGAEFNEEQIPLDCCPGELQNNWQAMNIRSGVNQTDCPRQYGISQGTVSIGGLTFTAWDALTGWLRNKGEPVG